MGLLLRRARAPGRLDRAAVEALGAPPQSACAEPQEPVELPGGCRAVGPYPGEFAGGGHVEGDMSLAEALAACAASAACPGVSSPWYTGSPWSPADAAARFTINADSYGCTFVLDCSPP